MNQEKFGQGLKEIEPPMPYKMCFLCRLRGHLAANCIGPRIRTEFDMTKPEMRELCVNIRRRMEPAYNMKADWVHCDEYHVQINHI